MPEPCNSSKRYVVISPVLFHKYLQDEIICGQEAEPHLEKLISMGAIREFSTDASETLRATTIETFVLPATMDEFADWFASIGGNREIMPKFFLADVGMHAFPVGNGHVFVNRAEPKAWETPFGYYRIALHSGYWGVTNISTEELHSREGISFRLIPLGDRQIKVQARCGIPALANYFQELLTRIPVRWPDAFLGDREPVETIIAHEHDPEISDKIANLISLQPGPKDAPAYHNTILALIKRIFDWALVNIDKEYETFEGRGRVDIMADNLADAGLLQSWRMEYGATSIPMECKNYTPDLGNDEFNQLVSRLGRNKSRLGILFCRTIKDPKTIRSHQMDRWSAQEFMILVIDDDTLKAFARMRLEGNTRDIEKHLAKMTRDIKHRNTNG